MFELFAEGSSQQPSHYPAKSHGMWFRDMGNVLSIPSSQCPAEGSLLRNQGSLLRNQGMRAEMPNETSPVDLTLKNRVYPENPLPSASTRQWAPLRGPPSLRGTECRGCSSSCRVGTSFGVGFLPQKFKVHELLVCLFFPGSICTLV